jgi:transporter family-2 protein
MPILGQIMGSLVVDHWGLLYAPQHPITIARIAGAMLVIAGVLIAIIGPRYLTRHRQDTLTDHNNDGSGEPSKWIWRMTGFVIGILSAFQITINGHLGILLDSSIKSAFISLFISTLLLPLLVALLRSRGTLYDTPKESGKGPWWIWLGGADRRNLCFWQYSTWSSVNKVDTKN